MALLGRGGLLLRVLVKVFAAFWAAEKTEEKKLPVDAWLPEVVRDAGTLPSSLIGVSGADIAFDNLLG